MVNLKLNKSRFCFVLLLFLLSIDLLIYDYGVGVYEVSKSLSLKLIFVAIVGFVHKLNSGQTMSWESNESHEFSSGFLLDFILTYVALWMGMIPLIYGFGYSKIISLILLMSIIWFVSALLYVFPVNRELNRGVFIVFYISIYGLLVFLAVLHFLNGSFSFPYKLAWPF